MNRAFLARHLGLTEPRCQNRGLSGRKFFKSQRVSSNHMMQGIKEQVGTLATVETERHFVQVGLQVLGADLVPAANDSALEQRERRFDGVRVGIAVNVDLRLVFDGLVFGGDARLCECGGIRTELVSHDYINILRDVFLNVLCQRARLHIVSMEETKRSLALPNADYDFLFALRVSDFVLMTALLSTDESFVNLYSTVEHGSVYFDHSATYAMAEIPCGLVRAFVLPPDRPLELHGAHALLGFTEQKCGKEPYRQRQVRVVEDRAASYSELVFAANALIAGVVFQTGHARILAAGTKDAFRPAQALQEFAATGVSGIHLINFRESHGSTS